MRRLAEVDTAGFSPLIRQQRVQRENNMANNRIKREKRSPSLHQKRIRNFTIGLVVASAVLAALIIWLVNRLSSPFH
jgi:hypothetical protein